MRNLLSSFLACCLSVAAVAQVPTTTTTGVSTTNIDGLRAKTIRMIAYTNCTAVTEPGREIKNAVIIIRDDRIINVGANLAIPDAADIRDLKGAWVYAGFIDPYVDAGQFPGKKATEEKDHKGWRENPRTPPQQGAHHWNQAVRPEREVLRDLRIDEKTVDTWTKKGFTTLGISSHDGIFSGNVAALLVRQGSAAEACLNAACAQRLDFRKGSSKTPYPSSLMGSIALIRQTFMDASWYGKARSLQSSPGVQRPEVNLSLDALSNAVATRTTFMARAYDEHDVFRWQRIAEEANIGTIIVGSGLEYRRVESIAPYKPAFILPLTFPKVPNVSDPVEARNVPLTDLMHWYWAPANAYYLDSVGCSVAFTSYNLKGDLFKTLREVRERGLSESKILAALTTIPARYLGIEDRTGRIAPNTLANLVVLSAPLLNEKTIIRHVVVAGDQIDLAPAADVDVRGTWTLTTKPLKQALKVRISGTAEAPSIDVRSDSLPLPATLHYRYDQLSFSFKTDTLAMAGTVRGSAHADSIMMSGTLIMGDGSQAPYVMRRDSAYVDRQPTLHTIKSFTPLPSMRPLGPYGLDSLPPLADVVLKNATVWTCGPQGILENADVAISDGKIVAVGKGLQGASTIDATGKHVTPGIIDEHSHIAIARGVNEGTHAVTCEVRIGDVLDPDDVNIYRQLAGGVTSSHLLHGSANPMGGQLQLIKLRWGGTTDFLTFQGAKPTVKFALGENVKQSNWGDDYTVRYPQTRMGVEQLMRDAFQAAREYDRTRKNAGAGAPVRRDLQLDALLEILHGERNIHCHSYQQSEILMLMRLAEEFGFRVHTFTHILEGYKVAKEMAAHGAMASSFSDWWAYKFEVYDAVPENPAIMHEQGVVVSVNSDDAEMARRLNQEAGKSVSYGGVSEEDAMKFVTINAAKQMVVDDQTGSLEPGKVADVVVWSGHPLSNTSRAELTYLDGRLMFSRDMDARMRNRDALLRNRMEQLALREMGKGAPSEHRGVKEKREYHCDDIDDEMAGRD
jgi:imidazolonepropionase-like amidohydrolase